MTTRFLSKTRPDEHDEPTRQSGLLWPRHATAVFAMASVLFAIPAVADQVWFFDVPWGGRHFPQGPFPSYQACSQAQQQVRQRNPAQNVGPCIPRGNPKTPTPAPSTPAPGTFPTPLRKTPARPPASTQDNPRPEGAEPATEERTAPTQDNPRPEGAQPASEETITPTQDNPAPEGSRPQGERQLPLTAQHLTAIARHLAIDSLAKYAVRTGYPTHCSEFVRDFVAAHLGGPDPALDGQVMGQIKNMDRQGSGWVPVQGTLQERFDEAQKLANSGRLVVIAWKNPNPQTYDTGHIAVVVPGSMVLSSVWDDLKVPQIAQAGPPNEAFADKPLGYGFNPRHDPSMITSLGIYVRNPEP